MSPRLFGFLWIVFAVSAGILWLAGVFTLTTLVVYGFIAFGLVFAGMMCVLPGVVSHPPVKTGKTRRPRSTQRAFKPVSIPVGKRIPAKLGFQ